MFHACFYVPFSLFQYQVLLRTFLSIRSTFSTSSQVSHNILPAIHSSSFCGSLPLHFIFICSKTSTSMRNSSLSLLLFLGLITMATSSWTTLKKKKNLRKRLKPRNHHASTGNLRASNRRMTSKRVVRIHKQSEGKEKLRVWRKKHGMN